MLLFSDKSKSREARKMMEKLKKILKKMLEFLAKYPDAYVKIEDFPL